MNFMRHLDLEGQHAFLGPSKHSWINYDEEKLIESYTNHQATIKGTRLHALASECISLGIKLPSKKQTLNMYVNDAIGFRMTPEQPLYFSDNCYGTADAICFRKNFLRIHDYKSGKTRTSMTQLEIYMALFCLEYDYKPQNIDSELRIYQFNDKLITNPEPERILYIMDKIIIFDKRIEKLKMED